MSGSRLDRRPRYGSHRYDDDLLLKVPPLLWLATVFLVRHLLLLGITFLPTTGEEIEVLRALVRPEFVFADLPAAVVMLAAIRRRRPCSTPVRRIWRYTREILTLSVGLYAVLVLAASLRSGQPLRDAIDEPILASFLLGLAVLAYLWRSRLVADVVRDCPGRRDG
ncbi:DUF2919 family protein [Thiocapsa sp.]|uniref:DUF2919 family protein n=1 Tax=Thiocapsa sp. TaxID=2024551 RepID=UPI0035931A61